MKKNFWFSSIFLFAILAWSFPAIAQQTDKSKVQKTPPLATSNVTQWQADNQPPAEAVKAAKDEWPQYLDGASDDLLAYWKVTRESLASASLGEPFRTYTITRESLSSYHKGEPTESLLSETDKWYFPVLVNDNPKLMVIVNKNKKDSSWNVVELGRAALEFPKIRKEWRKSKEYIPVFIEVPWSIYLFYLPGKDSANLTLIPTLPYMVPVTSYPNLDKVEHTVEWLNCAVNVCENKAK